jgi:hypothetical protein
VRYPSFDDLKIPALLYKPHEASPEHKVPALAQEELEEKILKHGQA